MTLELLKHAELRPLSDVKEWWKDGFALIHGRYSLWIRFSLVGFGVMIIASLLGGLLGGSVSALGDIGGWLGFYLATLPSAIALTLLQSGGYRLMQKIVDNQPIVLKEMFWLIQDKNRRVYWQYIALFVAINGSFAILQTLIFPQSLILLAEGKVSVNDPQSLLMASIFSVAAQFIYLSLTWGILPILNDFPKEKFQQVFQLQLIGSLKNIMPILAFTIILFLAFMGLSLVLSLILMISQMLMLIALMATMILLWPLMLAWEFSVARHLFMSW